jgi:hypothetical protein
MLPDTRAVGSCGRRRLRWFWCSRWGSGLVVTYRLGRIARSHHASFPQFYRLAPVLLVPRGPVLPVPRTFLGFFLNFLLATFFFAFLALAATVRPP